MQLPQDPMWFGQYRLTARIATGGMAEVYVGRHITPEGKMGPMIAVKRLLPHLLSDPNIVQMFVNEARITAQISHPNVVQIIDLGHETGEPFIVMELLEGHSMADLRLKAAETGRHIPLAITLRILCDACRGLDAAHRAVDEKGRFLCIVHRDFTPDNIHVGVNGSVKVIDFGIARAEHISAGTEPGTSKGKFFYMSPEMIAGRPVDHRADLFAAGVMLYEQLCGRRPFTGLSPDEVVQRISAGNPRKPTEFDPSVPPALEAICLMALAPLPENRFASLDELIQAIESLGGNASLASPAEVGQYVSELFPIDKDPKRLTLKRARLADPSHVLSAKQAAAVVPRRSLKVNVPTSWLLAAGGGLAMFALLAGGVWGYGKLFPTHSPAQQLAIAQQAKDPGTREKSLRAVAEDPTATAAQLRKAGELLLDASSFEAAVWVAERYAARFPKDGQAYLIEARGDIGLRKGKRAESALEKAISLNPTDPQPDLILADLKEVQGDYSGALEALARAGKKQPSRSLTARRGFLLSQMGRLEDAGEALTQVLQRRFEPESAAELGFVRLREGKLPEAGTVLRRALKENPRLAKGHYYLGAVLYQQGDVKGAQRAYEEADRWGPADPRPLVALCQLQLNNREPEKAEATKATLAQRFPSQAAELTKQCHP